MSSNQFGGGFIPSGGWNTIQQQNSQQRRVTSEFNTHSLNPYPYHGYPTYQNFHGEVYSGEQPNNHQVIYDSNPSIYNVPNSRQKEEQENYKDMYEKKVQQNYVLQQAIQSLQIKNKELQVSLEHAKNLENDYDQIIEKGQRDNQHQNQLIKTLQEKNNRLILALTQVQKNINQKSMQDKKYQDKYNHLLKLSLKYTDQYQQNIIQTSRKYRLMSQQFDKYKNELQKYAVHLTHQQQLNTLIMHYNQKVTQLRDLINRCNDFNNFQMADLKMAVRKETQQKIQKFLNEMYEIVRKQKQEKVDVNKENQIRKKVMKGIGLTMKFLLDDLKRNINSQNLKDAQENYQELEGISGYLFKG